MIDKEKIWVVTGTPRSGTSLMMQTLRHLGVPIAGEKFPTHKVGEAVLRAVKEELSFCKIDWFGDTLQELVRYKHHLSPHLATRLSRHLEIEKKAKEMNPRGFYEVPGAVISGIKSVKEFGGKAIKIISSGIVEKNSLAGPIGTPLDIIDKMIVCVRHPAAVSDSQKDIATGAEFGSRDMLSPNPRRYLLENGVLCSRLAQANNWMAVDFDEFLENPQDILDKVIEFLEIKPSEQEYNNALKNIKPRLNRSKKRFQGWTEGYKDDGVIAEKIFESIIDESRSGLVYSNMLYSTFVEKQKLEGVRWYCPKYCTMMNPMLHRQIESIKELRDRFLKDVEQKTFGVFLRDDPLFEEPNNLGEYTIKRPEDIGDLKAHYVVYDGEVVSWEAAYTKAKQRRYK